MVAKKESTAPSGEINAVPYKVIKIVARPARKRKSRKHIIIVKAVTYCAAILALYGLLLLEFHMAAGLTIFGLAFTYLMAYTYANGGFR